MIRLGLIGCGAWGWRYIPAALEAGNCQVTVLSCAVSKLSRVPIDWKTTKWVDNWRFMLSEAVDAFIVATPPDTHAEICGELLERGRPVMVEKPMALDMGSAMWMANAADRAAVPLLVNHLHLFSPAYETFRAQTMSWDSAEVVAIGGGPGPVRSYSALWDYGPHDVAMFLGLLRTGEKVRDVSANREGGRFRISIGAGSRRALVSVWNDGDKKRLLVAMNEHDDVLVYDDTRPAGSTLLLNERPVSVDTQRPLTRSVRAFANVVQGGSSDWRFSPMLGVEVTRILELADVSAKERRHGNHG